MGEYEIIGNNDLKLVYCDNIIDNSLARLDKHSGRVYRALADQISRRRGFMSTEEIFPIQLIYTKYHVMVAEYVFVFDRVYNSIELETINMNQTAIDSIIDKEGTYIYPDENLISKELALRIYNKFREIFPRK